jgi:hypothetical protein
MVCGVALHAPALAGAARLPDAASGIHLGVAFGYGARATAPAAVDYVWGASHPDPRAHAEAYLPFHADWRLARGDHDLRWYRRHHPAWVVYRCNRRTPAYYPGLRNVPLDYRNAAVRRYQLRHALSLLRTGFSGIDVDNFTLTNYQSRCGVFHRGRWRPLGYSQAGRFVPGDERLIADMVGWLRYMSSHLHRRFPARTLTVNSSVQLNGGVRFSRRILPYIDADFDEGGFTQFGAGPLTDAAWAEQVRWADLLALNHKGLVLTALLDRRSEARVTRADLMWALGNYLLVKSNHTFTYVYANARRYGSFHDREIYRLDIGLPLGAHRGLPGGLAFRRFSNGAVLVNPSSQTTRGAVLPSGYRGLGGQTVTGVTLAPASARILLTSSARAARR